MSQWKTDTEPKKCFIDECAHSEEAKPIKINVSQDTWRVLVALTKEVKLEWQAFLCGSDVDGIVEIDGYWIPKQKVTSGTVENLDIIDEAVIREKRIVVSIHSHAEMSCFHSQIDMESTCKSNWVKHHITVNNKLEYVAKSQYALPCGRIAFIKSEMFIGGQEEKVEIAGLDNIQKPCAGTGMAGWSSQGTDMDMADQEYWRSRRMQEDFYDKASVGGLHIFNRHQNHHTQGKGLCNV